MEKVKRDGSIEGGMEVQAMGRDGGGMEGEGMEEEASDGSIEGGMEVVARDGRWDEQYSAGDG